MARQTSTVRNYRPEFPEESVERYPTLTLALGNSYPGLGIASPAADEGHHAFEFLSHYDAPMSFSDMPSPASASAWLSEPPMSLDFGLPTSHPEDWHILPRIPASQVWTTDGIPSETTIAPRNNSTFVDNPSCQDLCIFSLHAMSDPQLFLEAGKNSDQDFSPMHHDSSLNLKSSEQFSAMHTAEASRVFQDNFIPICQTRTVLSDSPQPLSKPPGRITRPPSFVPASKRRKTPTRTKVHGCPRCHKFFSRPCDVRTHMNMHTLSQPFLCTVCRQRFGVKSNMLRHGIQKHDLPRTGMVRPDPPYHLVFNTPGADIDAPPVQSDNTPMPRQVVWDSEGPFAMRQKGGRHTVIFCTFFQF
ncbi:hypothetical protein C8R44DRAFT_121864 [Mycena epipterygia]|nr:hypothetical protein C8R44DRAFT_121864 [Mycena epipterygia]